MLSAAKVTLYFWAEAIATTCFTQNRSLVIPRRDGENLGKMKEKAETVTALNELDLLFSLLFDELLNGTTPVVLKSSAVTAADALDKRQKQHTTPFTSTTVAADTPPL
nr:hypothetical protein [Tanacetum cinerariifolium]